MAHLQHTESVPVIPLLGRPKGVGGRRRKRHRQGKKNKIKMEIASRTLLLQLLRFLNLKCGDTPPSLSSWCGASVSVPVPVRSSRTAMHLQCFVLAVCL